MSRHHPSTRNDVYQFHHNGTERHREHHNDDRTYKYDSSRDDRDKRRKYDVSGEDKYSKKSRPSSSSSSLSYAPPSSSINPHDMLEINMQLQLAIKTLQEDISRYKGEVEHLRRVVDDGRSEGVMLKREISSLKDEVERRKQQIRDERLQQEEVFQQNQYVISQLEEELHRVKYSSMSSRVVLPPAITSPTSSLSHKVISPFLYFPSPLSPPFPPNLFFFLSSPPFFLHISPLSPPLNHTLAICLLSIF